MDHERSDRHQNEILLEHFRSSFDYERSSSFGTPSGNYFWFRKRREVLRLLRKHARDLLPADATAASPALLLDLGCDTGTDLYFIHDLLKPTGPWRFMGMDANPGAVAQACLKRSHYGADVEFLQADITERLPLEDGTVQVAYCSEVVEHLPFPEQLLAEIHRVLRPGGYLLLTTPNEPNLFQRSFWSSARRKRIESEVRKQEAPAVKLDGKNVFIRAHISLRTIGEWDASLRAVGFSLVDFGRGSSSYGGGGIWDTEWALTGRFLMEGVLDALPRRWVRSVSDELISLYQRAP
jgi:SAM-dependent methyltransferase